MPLQEHASQIHIGLTRRQSRGRIGLRSENPKALPRIFENYLENPQDRETFLEGIKFIQEITRQPSTAPFTGDQVFPGKNAQAAYSLDTCLRDHIAMQ